MPFAPQGGGGSGTPAAGSITLAMLADLATDRLVGRTTAGTGVPEAVPFTDAGQAIAAAASASAQRTALGLGTAAVEDVCAASADAGTQTVVSAMGGPDTVDRNTCAGLDSTNTAIGAVQAALDDLKSKLRTSGLLAT